MGDTELIDEYLAGTDKIRQAVDGLSPGQLRARPVAGMWSPLELICHVVDSDCLFADRMKRILSEDRPPMLFSDPDRCVTALAYHERDAVEEIAFLALLRRQMARILRVQPPEAWQRVGIHNKEGERTLEQVVRKAIDHLAHHLAILRTKRQALEGSA